MKLNKDYWENRYAEEHLGWDIGYVSTPLRHYIDQLEDKSIKILIPGAGHGYEAIYLFQNGFTNVYVVDIAGTPLRRIKEKCPAFPKEQLLEGDFFEIEMQGFDLVLEQTFFCALDPELRPAYMERMFQILKPGGKLSGLFFDFPLSSSGPPFGGSYSEYEGLFKEKFKIKSLERATNSIAPRQGKELFFIFEK